MIICLMLMRSATMHQSRILVIVSLLICIRYVIESSGDQSHGSKSSGNGQSMVTTNLRSYRGLFINFSDCILDHQLGNLTSNGLINITAEVMLLSIVSLVALENISIIGHDNPTVNCDNTGGIYFDNCHNCTIIGITWEKCGNKTNSKPAMKVHNSSNVIIQNCSFQHSVTQVIVLSEMSGNVRINSCQFAFNFYFEGHGTVIRYLSKTNYRSNFQFTISSCNFTENNGAFGVTSLVYISPSSNKSMDQIYFTNVAFSSNYGTPIYVSYQKVIIRGFIMFKRNRVYMGGGMFITNHSNAVFQKSQIKFIDNTAMDFGGALFIQNSNIVFNATATVMFDGNVARVGGAFYVRQNSGIKFDGNCTVTINNNHAAYYGGALDIKDYCDVTFDGNSTVTISNNRANRDGGAIHIRDYSYVTFKGNSSVTISNNRANRDGGAIYIRDNSDVTFKENSAVTISNNQANNGFGALYITSYSGATFKENSSVTISNNHANRDGGALYIRFHSNVTFKGTSRVTISNNQANDNGGALYIFDSSMITFKETSRVTINNNQADNDGGALYIWQQSYITFKASAIVIICNNKAYDGGALYVNGDNVILFQAKSAVKFDDNKALGVGGALHSSNIVFSNCTIAFNRNEAFQGGAIFTRSIVFNNSSMQFISNKAALGGALHVSNITFEESTTTIFENNEATVNGGAIYSHSSNIIAKQNSIIIFTNNSAEDGGAIFASASTLLVSEYSNVTFNKNIAGQNGGAIYFNNQINASFNNFSVVSWTSNTANSHGGAIYSTITQNTKYFNISEINGFSDNTAGVAGNLLYIHLPKSCNNSCLTDRIVGISNQTLYKGTLDKNISSSPKVLKFYDTAKCVSNESAQCEKYYISSIMLGQEITIYPCLLDHYNKPAEVTQFRIIGENNQNYSVHGLEYTSISCNKAIGGISIVGNQAKALNYSIYFSSYATVREVISANVTIELTPCHLGFQYQSKSKRCECYNNSRIVSCSGSSSTITRGYWFGHVNKIPTVTICPINYCNFTCCKATSGHYHLSPVRINQCRLHRDGTACGNCVTGYTLPYYSSECDQCTTTWTIVVVIITVLYWIAVVIAIFVMMHYRISIGYLYAITYYYSIVDVLLIESVDYLSDGLYIFINVMYSIAELTPQFLGKLCLMRNISGIDQQFIHYMHPLAVSLILVIITLAARCSRRVSLLISRGVIHVICLLLLLSYTSVTTTSLMLLKYSTFVGVNKVYSFISPNIEYFHGRHLAYSMIALLCTIVIVVGLPLLLLLEPLLNRKINFIKIKPLLDQFQGCYKDKFRWFAAYYMVCRLVIITITIIFPSNNFAGQYLLITVCAAIVLIHLMVKPYNATVLNILDGILLLFLVLTTVLLITEFDASNLAVPVTLLLLILPLIVVGIVYLLACKGNIKGILAKFFNRVDAHEFDNIEMPARNFDIIIDESMRQNATICAM